MSKLYLVNPKGKATLERFADAMDEYGKCTCTIEKLSKDGPDIPVWDFSNAAEMEKAYEELNGKKKWKGNKKPSFKTESMLKEDQEKKKQNSKIVHYSGPAKEVFPYAFKKTSCAKKPLERFHSQLDKGNYDIAFEVEWENLTPAAFTPCENISEDEKLKKTWLTYSDSKKLCISPFTVKSAVASAYSLLCGSCLRTVTRVIDNNNDEATGKYPYPGRYKIYRVSQSNSKFGIVNKIDLSKDPVEIEIQPAQEICAAEDKPFVVGKEYYADLKINKNQFKPRIATNINETEGDNKIIYVDAYKAGVDAHFSGEDLGKKNYAHRFYQKKGNILEAKISKYQFDSLDKMRKKVYVGGYAQNNDPKIKLKPKQEEYRDSGHAWYQDLNTLEAGSPVYYQVLDGKVTSIGKNFNYKTIFSQEETVHPDSTPCTTIEAGCPRCALFGFVNDKDGDDKKESYKGRFKSSTLISECSLDKTELVKLPVQMEPKANKRDNPDSLYYERGVAAGKKVYTNTSNGTHDLKSLKTFCDNFSNNEELQGSDADELRETVLACPSHISFTGTLGAENVSLKEAAAILFVLNSSESDHGFKLGRGKALGIGTFTSTIKKVWLRSPDYKWIPIVIEDEVELSSLMNEHMQGFATEWDKMKKLTSKMNSLKGHEEKSPSYPNVKTYWKDARKLGM